MEYFRPDVRVGALILVALLLLIATAILVGGVSEWWTPTQEYTVLLPNANLLRRRAKVSYAGSPVGEVTAIAVHHNTAWQQQYPGYPVAVSVSVHDAMLFRDDARVELRTDGFIGERYLDIAPGVGQALPPGSVVVGSIGGVEGLVAAFTGVGGGLGEIKNALHGLLDDRGQATSLPMVLGSLRQLLEELRPRLFTLIDALQVLVASTQQTVTTTGATAGQTLARLDTTLMHLDTAVADNSVELQRLMRAVHTSLSEVNKTLTVAQKTLITATTALNTTQGDTAKLLTSLRTLSGDVQRGLAETLTSVQHVLKQVETVIAQNDRNLYSSIEALRDTAEQLKATVRQVYANPSVLLWGPGSQKAPESLGGVDPTTRVLQDRGRVGRYDKLQ
jgi:ABC-type transporter Mla subunit MlaD